MPNIALIDSDPNLAKICETAFASKGHKLLFHANNCSEAYDRLKAAKLRPDMIVVSSDHDSDALQKIRAEYPSIIIQEVRGKGQG